MSPDNSVLPVPSIVGIPAGGYAQIAQKDEWQAQSYENALISTVGKFPNLFVEVINSDQSEVLEGGIVSEAWGGSDMLCPL
jgi:hypothetical protein